jgi:hypothetical protein
MGKIFRSSGAQNNNGDGFYKYFTATRLSERAVLELLDARR